MSPSIKLISSREALAVIAAIAHRPRVNRASLLYLVSKGRIKSYPIHPTRHRYDLEEVIAAARLSAEQNGLEPGNFDSALLKRGA